MFSASSYDNSEETNGDTSEARGVGEPNGCEVDG